MTAPWRLTRPLRGLLAVPLAAALLCLPPLLPAAAESLVEALVATYQNNADLLAAREELRVVNEQRPQAIAGWLPTVTVQGTLDDTSREGDRLGASDQRTVSEALQYRQGLYRGGALSANLAQAENTIRRQRALLLNTEQQVLLNAASIYMDVIQNAAIVELNRSNIRVLEERLRATEAMFRVGDMTQADLSQAQTRLAQARAALIAAQGTLDSTRATYRQIVGNAPAALQAPGPLGGLPGQIEDAVVIALRENPTLVAADLAERVARNQVRARLGALLPSVDLVGELRRDDYRVATPDTRGESASAQLQVTVPLYQSGAEYSRVREAKKLANQRQIETISLTRKVEEQVVRAWQDLDTARASVEAYRQQVAAAEQALASVQREVDIGRRPLLDLLDAQQELLDAQVNLVIQQRNATVNEFALLNALGGLTARGLQLPTDYFDPEADYETTRWRLFGTGID
ncbi:TolC family outer membrane protein [Oceanibaculum pacificum]|uniref:TolC family outer membrane protein n=1 Tax=Oceanibaculum pacificum TaxID=580166 RepID=UPI000A00F460|nr:TolC family outer membrane protein [Oceanibaculum pacificum]